MENVELIVTNAAVYTGDREHTWAEAFAVSSGKIAAVGTAAEIDSLATADTEVLDAGGHMVMPGLCDVHTHLGYGGTQAAWELAMPPIYTLDEVLDKVRTYAADLGPDEWVVGGNISSGLLEIVSAGGYLEALDKASGGRPVLLREESMHNRWVNSRALEIIGVSAGVADPEGGTYVRDASGVPTGVLLEMASKVVEDAMFASIAAPDERLRVAFGTALRIINSFGITAAQDAGTMEASLRTLAELDDKGDLPAWVVCSMPARPFFEEGIVGEELFATRDTHRREHVRPDFVKLFLDGVPMTRTSAMLSPYVCHGDDEDPEFRGEPYWSLDDVVSQLERCCELGLGAKLHCAGDGSVRLALDAIERVRATRGSDGIFQIAHVVYVDPEDVPRFGSLDVVADASPYIWFPSGIQDMCAHQVSADAFARSFPCRDLVESGALLAGGSDWPVVPLPNPWLGMETLVTRANPDPTVGGELNGGQRLSLEQAVAVFTRNGAEAMGLGEITGTLRTGLSADFIVLNHNIFSIDPGQISQTQVEATYFKGTKVFDASTRH